MYTAATGSLDRPVLRPDDTPNRSFLTQPFKPAAVDATAASPRSQAFHLLLFSPNFVSPSACAAPLWEAVRRSEANALPGKARVTSPVDDSGRGLCKDDSRLSAACSSCQVTPRFAVEAREVHSRQGRTRQQVSSADLDESPVCSGLPGARDLPPNRCAHISARHRQQRTDLSSSRWTLPKSGTWQP